VSGVPGPRKHREKGTECSPHRGSGHVSLGGGRMKRGISGKRGEGALVRKTEKISEGTSNRASFKIRKKGNSVGVAKRTVLRGV